MNGKKVLCSLALIGGLTTQAATQLVGQSMHLPSELDKHTKIHIAAGEGLQWHDNEIALVLIGDFVSDVHLGAMGDHDIGGELGFVLRDGEQSLFFTPKIELFQLMGCKFFVKETIELEGESVHFAPGGGVEMPLRVGSFRGYCFASGLMEHSVDKHGTVLVLEIGVAVDLK